MPEILKGTVMDNLRGRVDNTKTTLVSTVDNIIAIFSVGVINAGKKELETVGTHVGKFFDLNKSLITGVRRG